MDTKADGYDPGRGFWTMGERFLNNDWVGLLAFAMLLATLHLTAWQALLAIVVFVQRTTPPPEWLVRERARARGETA